jgi:ribosomal protein S18 acetylase RimI-like enzyme
MRPHTIINAGIRFLRGLTRPSKTRNAGVLRERGESSQALAIREAKTADIPALARLHVETWNATHGTRPNGPTYELRERQWRDAFALSDGSWFCFVIERPGGEFVGFAKGTVHDDASADFAGQLSKIYLLREYQRLGLGRRLMGHVARRFLGQGISSMLVFSQAQNPSCRFFEALGGERLYAANGEFHGGYGWRDLGRLASVCPPD